MLTVLNPIYIIIIIHNRIKCIDKEKDYLKYTNNIYSYTSQSGWTLT